MQYSEQILGWVRNSKEMQSFKPMTFQGRGKPVLAGQSRIISNGTHCYIELTMGYWAKIDLIDFGVVQGRKWGAVKKGNTVYAANGRVYIHRLLLNPSDGMVVDHISGNALDNTRKNIRLCRRSDNNKNIGKSVKNTSGFKGAFFKKDKGKWYSQIKHDGKTIGLGYFPSAQSAHDAYCIAATKYHGKFARFA